MNKEEYRKMIDEVLYLSGCVVNDEEPEKARIDKLDMSNLYKAADKHMLTAIVGYALKKAGIYDKYFIESMGKSVRKTAVMEIDKELLFERLEEEKIRYMPLKGIIIKELYPATGIRQMADFDILCDGTYIEKVNEIMVNLGFSCDRLGKGVDNTYLKKPVSNFEMHTALFGDYHDKKLYSYYRNIFDRLQKDDDNAYGYHFSHNDMYIYFTAHEYKHYSGGGTGLRSLLDTYVIWKNLGDTLDTEYIAEETKKLGIHEFEQANKQLALDVFGKKSLTEEEKKMLDYMIYSGTYGDIQNLIENEVARYGGGKKGKARFILKKIFLPMNQVKIFYPFFYKYKILLPCLLLYRIFKSLTVSRRKNQKLLKRLKKVK